MPRDNDLDGTPPGVFGAKLRYYRERAGLSQTDVAVRVNVSHDVISKIETGERPPAKDFPERLDAVPELDTRGSLARLWKNLRTGLRHRTIPEWFQPWADIEARATTLRSYEPLLIPGLLQTEDYARAILAACPGGRHDDLDDRVGGRISRQAILARANPPQLWSVVDEGVLHRCIGGPKVMHDQLAHLTDLAENPQTTIQVIPASAGAHAGLLGAFNIADQDGSPRMVYLENAGEAQIADSRAIVARAMLRFDALRSEALPRAASRDLILKVAEERWT